MNELLAQWAAQCAEWDAIFVEMRAARSGQAITPFQVTLEQRKRALARGARLLTGEAFSHLPDAARWPPQPT